MQRHHAIGHAPRTRALGRDVAGLRDCVGCADCQGLCAALLETLTLPDLVLKRTDP